MGGLLPDWPSQQENKIKSPQDAASLWDEMSKKHDIPMSGDVWINDPLESSFPPSLAFKAAQLQDNEKAIFFLRKIKEFLFIEKKNINKWEHLETAALIAGLDVALLKRDIEGRAKSFFEKDLQLAEKMGIRVFPTLVIETDDIPVKIIKGFQTYEALERLIRHYLPQVVKNTNYPTPEELFHRYTNMTEKEFCFLLNLGEEEGKELIFTLFEKGVIESVQVDQAAYWRLV
jgi:predicted DsbA family dithiol-disulfide isomerase